jgi:hypothetical protein
MSPAALKGFLVVAQQVLLNGALVKYRVPAILLMGSLSQCRPGIPPGLGCLSVECGIRGTLIWFNPLCCPCAVFVTVIRILRNIDLIHSVMGLFVSRFLPFGSILAVYPGHCLPDRSEAGPDMT